VNLPMKSARVTWGYLVARVRTLRKVASWPEQRKLSTLLEAMSDAEFAGASAEDAREDVERLVEAAFGGKKEGAR
jgi:hypothetical protein